MAVVGVELVVLAVTQVKMTRPMATTIIPKASSVGLVGLVKKSNIAAPFWWEHAI